MRRTILTIALTALCASVAAADLMVVMSVEEERVVGKKTDRQTYQTRSYFSQDKMAKQNPDGTWRIIRFDKQLIWDIAKDGKTYREATFEETREQAKKLGRQRAARIKEIEALLANPAVPQASKDRLRKQLQPKVYKVETIGQEKIGELACTRYRLTRNGVTFMDVWGCETLDPGVEFNRIQSLSPSAQPGLNKELAKIKGVWIKSLARQKGPSYSIRRQATATQVETAAVPAKTFELPAGARKIR